MAKDPTFPFYAQDYLIDTIRWDRGMKSLHIDLLAESWINGKLLDSNHGSTTVQPSHPIGLSLEDQKIWERIKIKWVFESGLWYNKKLEGAREDRIEFRQRQSDRGKKSAQVRYSKTKKFKTIPVKSKPNHGSTTVQPKIEDGEEEENLLKKAWRNFYEMRDEIKKPATYRAKEMLQSKLNKLCGDNEELAIKILNQSTVNSWKDIYEVKENNNGKINNQNTDRTERTKNLHDFAGAIDSLQQNQG